ncbi:hypothetical protein F511_42329 [Dorcoceras hygrometricum]|uniref:Uncharacterized protein n=1 Tax=Dorcoceras hygrometricum TaxID=472368 RepID=A0A2Z7A3R9_9LAMI|nr:hypothetical protein F511_42329 [Dorcoceras hygrometricum]
MGRYLSADMVMSCFLLLCVGVAIADLALDLLCACVYYQNDDVAPTSSKPVDTSINQQVHKPAAKFNDTKFLNHPTLPEEIRAHNQASSKSII